MCTLEKWVLIFCWIAIWFTLGLTLWQNQSNSMLNDPELRQCLSQSGTTWQWGECVIILNK